METISEFKTKVIDAQDVCQWRMPLPLPLSVSLICQSLFSHVLTR